MISQVKLIAEPWDVGAGRLPGRQLPAAVDGVERQVPRHRARLLARRAGHPRRVRVPAHRQLGPLPGRRPPAVRVDQLRHRARRVHPGRPGLVQRQAQRGQRRGRQRRREPQPVVELRGRGPDRRRGGARPARPPAAQLPRHADAVPGRADAAARRRARPHPARQQQRLLPGQRDRLDGLVAGRQERRPAGVHRGRARAAAGHPVFRRRRFFAGPPDRARPPPGRARCPTSPGSPPPARR